MEKKRRARINNCLTQLKSLVLQAMRKDTNQYSKLEKADILEMTVKHLRQLQRQQVTSSMSHDPTVVTKYKAGFNECANEVVRYLGSVQGVDSDTRNRLMNHLGNLVTQLNNQSQDQCQQPLNVQIPQAANQQGLNGVQNSCLLMPSGVHTSQLMTSPVVLQQVQNVNVPNVYSQGPQSQQLHQRNLNNQSQFCGSFQIVPNTNSPAAVALYLGQSQAMSMAVQTSPINTCTQAVPLYSNRTPPRTKASMKVYDTSAFSQVTTSDISNSSSPSCSPTSHEMSSYTSSMMSSQLDLSLHGLAVKCGRTPSPLKVEDVWRPW